MSNTFSSFANNPMFAALGDEQRKAMTAAFDAMSTWRHELTSMSEKNTSAVYDKMSAAAKAVGWPAEFVDMSRQQMQSVTKMQSQALEQIMGMWEKQATQPPGKFEMPTFPGMPSFGSAFGQAPQFPSFPSFPGMPSFPGFGMPAGGASAKGGAPGLGDMASMPMVPLQFWMQAAEMWQKSWEQALSTWMETQKSMMNGAAAPTKTSTSR